MNFFQKAKASVMKAAVSAQQLVASVSAITTELSNGVLVGDSKEKVKRQPHEELVFLFRECCAIIDDLADTDDHESPESDRQLYESKVRPNLKQMIHLLQAESERWLVAYGEAPDPEISELPCIDAFLRLHMMQELCTRAIRDMPRGCLPLVMGSTALLLRMVRYPLLPHTTVHKPIANLVSVASRFDAMNVATSAASRAELMGYKKRIDIDLTNLISTLWRKIADNPPLLDYFTLFDMRPSRIEGFNVPLHAQMDILTALISLMGKPRVGVFAKRAFLVAVGMHDRRVDSFIVLNTDLVESVIAELSKRFQVALENIQRVDSSSVVIGGPSFSSGVAPATTMGSVSTSNSLLRAAQNNAQLNPTAQIDTASGTPDSAASTNAFDAFVRVVKFMDILVSSCTSLRDSRDNLRTIDPDSKLESPSSPLSPLPETPVTYTQTREAVLWDEAKALRTPGKPARYSSQDSARFARAPSLKLQLLREYLRMFLHNNVRAALLDNAEAQVLATNTLLRRLLFELSQNNCTESKDLLRVTSAYLCLSVGDEVGRDDGPSTVPLPPSMNSVLITRALSISKPAAASSTQLIVDLIRVAPLEHAIGFLALRTANCTVSTPLTPGSGQSKLSISSPSGHLAAFIATESKRTTKDYPNTAAHTDYITLVGAINKQYDVSPSGSFGIGMLDERLAHVCAVLVNSSKRPDDDPTIERGKGFGIDQQYIAPIAKSILAKVADRVVNLDSQLQTGLGSCWTSDICDSDLMALVAKKLSQFSGLKSCDQVVVTSLISSCITLLSARTVISTNTFGEPNMERYVLVEDSANFSFVECELGLHVRTEGRINANGFCAFSLDPLFDILLAVEKLWLDLRVHCAKIVDFGVKFSAFRHVMQASILAKRIDPVLKKLVDKESPQSTKILESAIMVREMLAEVRGCIRALHQLRLSLSALSTTPKKPRSILDEESTPKETTRSVVDEDDGWGYSSNVNPEVEELAVVEEEDIWERNEAIEAQARKEMDDASWGMGVDVREEDFLNDCSQLEFALDSLL